MESNFNCSRCDRLFTTERARSIHEFKVHQIQSRRICSIFFVDRKTKFRHKCKYILKFSWLVSDECGFESSFI